MELLEMKYTTFEKILLEGIIQIRTAAEKKRELEDSNRIYPK